jgi:hypothetical protein
VEFEGKKRSGDRPDKKIYIKRGVKGYEEFMSFSCVYLNP